jgi:hypothetical protein
MIDRSTEAGDPILDFRTVLRVSNKSKDKVQNNITIKKSIKRRRKLKKKLECLRPPQCTAKQKNKIPRNDKSLTKCNHMSVQSYAVTGIDIFQEKVRKVAS